MMNDQGSHEPDSIRDLIKAGVGEEARPNTAQRAEMIARLRAEVRLAKVKSEFPPAVLIGVPIVLLLMTVWLVATNSPEMEMVRTIIFLCLGLNMLCIPITGIVIIRRRHYVPKN